MPRIITIQRRYMELGRIRMGAKSERGNPTRLEAWRLTSASQTLLEAAAKVYGGHVQEWTDAPDKGYFELYTSSHSLDVMLPPGDPYSQYYELWDRGGCKRRCDGETELLSGAECKCDPDARECKITTRISVMLPRIPGLGVWRLESHGYYAAAELPDQLDLLRAIGGSALIAGILRIEQRSAKRDGKTQRFPVPVLDLPGVTLAAMTEGRIIVNPPAALEAGKPALLTGTVLPDEAAFDNGSPGFGNKPALPELDQPSQGDGPNREAAVAHANPVPATARFPGVDQPASPEVMAKKRYEWAGLRGWSKEALEQAAQDATNHGVGTMDIETWRAFVVAVVQAGPNEQGSDGGVSSPGEPVAAVDSPPTAAPASPSEKVAV